MGVAEKSSGAPRPAKVGGLLREAKGLILVALAAYLLPIFATYRRTDPAWSHSATGAATGNAGGVVGAWLSDVLLYLFGVSAYWWIALCLYVVVWGYRRLDGRSLIDRRPLGVALAGFAALLVASAAIEGLRLHSIPAELPHVPGGLVGDQAGQLASAALGFTGATLVLLTLTACALSLFTGVSWIAFSELVGGLLEALYGLALRAWERCQDRKLGELAREEREFIVETEKKREEHHPPLRIEPPAPQPKKHPHAQNATHA